MAGQADGDRTGHTVRGVRRTPGHDHRGLAGVVHADRRNYATALITLDPDALAQWGRAQGLTATSSPC